MSQEEILQELERSWADDDARVKVDIEERLEKKKKNLAECEHETI